MSAHESERHEALLVDVLGTDGDPRSALEATPLSGCATCRALLEEHVELAQSLEGLGAVERADSAAALAAAPPPAGAAEQQLRERLMQGARRRHPTELRRWIGVAAAAAVLAVFALLLRKEAPGEQGPVLGSGIELLHPVHEVDSFAPFRWEDEGPGTGWYRVVVSPLEGEHVEDDPTDSGPLREKSWTPEAHVMERWGTRIRWTLEIHGGAGQVDLVESESTWAQLSSR